MRKARTSRKMRSTIVSLVIAEAAEDLQRAVDDAEDRLGAEHLGHGAFGRRALPLIEQPSRVPDGKPAHVNVHGVVGQHEAHALMLAERFAERHGACARTRSRCRGRGWRSRASACSASVGPARAAPGHSESPDRPRPARRRRRRAGSRCRPTACPPMKLEVHGAEHAADLEGRVGQLGQEHGGVARGHRRCGP